jgi:MFS family permease
VIFVPNGVMALATAQRWASLVRKTGPWPVASAGILLMLAGYLWTLQLGQLSNLLVFGLASVAMGAGYAMSYSAANITAVAGVRPEERGTASGLFIAAFQIGGGVTLGVVASVFTTSRAHDPGLDPYRWAIATTAITAVLAALLSITGMTRRDRRASPPVRSPSQASSCPSGRP